jgi:hypothetical protein
MEAEMELESEYLPTLPDKDPSYSNLTAFDLNKVAKTNELL